MTLAAALALLLAADPAFAPSATALAPDPAAALVTDRGEWDLKPSDPDDRFRAHLVVYSLRPGGQGKAADAARALLVAEEADAGGIPMAVLVLDRRGHRTGIAVSNALAAALESSALRQVLREVEADLARGRFDERAVGAVGGALHDAAPDAGAPPPVPTATAGAPDGSPPADAQPDPRTPLPPPLDAPEEPFEPLWKTGPGWAFAVVAAILVLLLWATGTPIVRGRDWALALVRLTVPVALASIGTWLLFGTPLSWVLTTALGLGLVLARVALGPARRREDARAPGPVGWLGEVVFAFASYLLILAVQLVVEILLNALLEAIFGGGGGGSSSSSSWGGGGGAFSGGGASGSW